MKKLITHSGSFHADDIFATATLSILLERNGEAFEIIRTRDPEIMKTADYIYDVGGVYDEATNKFDHHQVGGAGKGENGIEYSSFGLVWKKFGAEVCESSEVAEKINKKLVSPIDAHDNGMDLVKNMYDTAPYFVQYFFYSMVPTWLEDQDKTNYDKMFLESVEIAKKILFREIAQARDLLIAEKSIQEIYENTTDKRIVTFDRNYPPAQIIQNFKETLFIIYPRSDGTFGVRTVRENSESFGNRKDFPKAWGGLMEEELQNITGVSDAIFCHRALFLAVARSLEGATKLAHIAIKNS
ncbi:MAG: MYG1 family protein [Patescibacteria group bacterium]